MSFTITENAGATIENTNATTDVPNNYEICQRSGFKVKRGTLVKDAYGWWVHPKFADSRHPQEFVRSSQDDIHGSVAPEQDDTFIEDTYPNGVSASTDL